MINEKELIKLKEEQKELDRLIQSSFCERDNLKEYDQEEGIFRIKIALFVEIGELANEIKTFKHWKINKQIEYKKAKEELIDCFHFFLSISNFMEINFEGYSSDKFIREKDISFNALILQLFSLTERMQIVKSSQNHMISNQNKNTFYEWLSIFEKIAEKLGMDFQEIEDVYKEKREININRQNSKQY